MQREARLKLLISLTAVVWTSAIATLYARGRLTAKAPVVLHLRAKPHVVRISLNGKPVENGTWIETPYRMNLTPGRNRLKLSRDGFSTTRLDVEGESGETLKLDDVILEQRPNISFGEVQLGTAADGQSYHFEIDDGLARGETPVLVDELVAGKHVLSIFPAWPSREGRLRCRFTIGAAKSEDGKVETLTIRMRKVAQKDPSKEPQLRLQGCDKPDAGATDPARKKKSNKGETPTPSDAVKEGSPSSPDPEAAKDPGLEGQRKGR